MAFSSRFFGAVVCLCVEIFAYTAAAQSIEEGKKLYLEADFRGAMRVFEAVLKSPTLTKEEGIEAHRYLAALQLFLGNRAAARSQAAASVALDPTVTPPEGAPTELSLIFRRAKQSTDGQPSQLHIELEPLAPTRRWVVHARLNPAPSALYDRISLRCVSSAGHVTETVRSADQAVVQGDLSPNSQRLKCEATVLSIGGATLFAGENEFPVPAFEKSRDRNSSKPIWPWIVGAAGVVVAATVIGVVLGTQKDDRTRLSAPQVPGWGNL